LRLPWRRFCACLHRLVMPACRARCLRCGAPPGQDNKALRAARDSVVLFWFIAVPLPCIAWTRLLLPLAILLLITPSPSVAAFTNTWTGMIGFAAGERITGLGFVSRIFTLCALPYTYSICNDSVSCLRSISCLWTWDWINSSSFSGLDAYGTRFVPLPRTCAIYCTAALCRFLARGAANAAAGDASLFSHACLRSVSMPRYVNVALPRHITPIAASRVLRALTLCVRVVRLCLLPLCPFYSLSFYLVPSCTSYHCAPAVPAVHKKRLFCKTPLCLHNSSHRNVPLCLVYSTAVSPH